MDPEINAEPFSPLHQIANADRVTVDGHWPRFHDAVLRHISIDIGDVRPDKEMYVFPLVRVTIDLSPQRAGEKWTDPWSRMTLLFEDCENINVAGYSYEPSINRLTFTNEPRGTNLNSTKPLPPYIDATFEGFPTPLLTLRCFKISVVETLGHEHGLDPR